MTDEQHTHFMQIALEEAHKASQSGEVPVGAVVVDAKGRILSKAHNQVETNSNVTEHAELIAIKSASAALNNWRLIDCTLYVTLEPCVMCAWAIKLSRIECVVFGAKDLRMGGFGTKIDLRGDEHIGVKTEIIAGVCEKECSKVLKDFFKKRREE